MVRASTPTHEFEMPFGSEFYKRVLITYKQNDEIVLEKTERDVSWSGNVMSLTLTQEETLKFNDNVSVVIQIRVLTHDDKSIPSNTMTIPCGVVLNPKVLT